MFSAVHPPHTTDSHQLKDLIGPTDEPTHQPIRDGIRRRRRCAAGTAKPVTLTERCAALITLMHNDKDIPTDPTSKAAVHQRAQLTILFINLWGMLVGWPLYIASAVPVQGLLPQSALPILLFIVGLSLRSKRFERPTETACTFFLVADLHSTGFWTRDAVQMFVSAVCLAFGVPVSAVLVGARLFSAAAPASANPTVPVVLLSIASLWAYEALALQVGLPAPNGAPTLRRPLARHRTDARKAQQPHFLPGLFTFGALLVGIVAPAWDAESAAADSFMQARAWSLLTAVVGGGLAVSLTAVFLGRALSPPVPRTTRHLSVPALLVLAGLGAVTYLVISG